MRGGIGVGDGPVLSKNRQDGGLKVRALDGLDHVPIEAVGDAD